VDDRRFFQEISKLGLSTTTIMTLKDQQVKDIVDELDCGFRVFVHKHSGALLSIPDFDNDLYAEECFYSEELRQLDEHFLEYLEITRPQSHESFEVMAGFAEQLDDLQLKEQLLAALGKRKPFQRFKLVINHSGKNRQLWFAFKAAQLKK
jgi:hypothetical protein